MLCSAVLSDFLIYVLNTHTNGSWIKRKKYDKITHVIWHFWLKDKIVTVYMILTFRCHYEAESTSAHSELKYVQNP